MSDPLTADQRKEIIAALTVLSGTARTAAALVISGNHSPDSLLQDVSAIDALAARIRASIGRQP